MGVLIEGLETRWKIEWVNVLGLIELATPQSTIAQNYSLGQD